MTAFRLGDIRRGGLLALASAALFGASTPTAKALTGSTSPFLLAGLLYLGSGIGLTLWRVVWDRERGLDIRRGELPWLAAAVGAGGVAGPALLMIGLTGVGGAAASLLLTLEGVFTALLAWLVFREPFNLRIGLGMAAIVAGGALLALQGGQGRAEAWGAAAVAAACLAWAVDNNCTSRISRIDAPTLAAVKGLAAGVVNLSLGLAVGGTLPHAPQLAAALGTGLLGYGVSLVLFVMAMREVGAARTGAYFSSAPFLGAVLSVAVLREPLSPSLAAAGALMALGVALHLTEPSAAAEN